LSSDDTPKLHFASYNQGQTTVVLIHGAFASGLNWDLGIPHLSSHRLLVPDLPDHGKSKLITRFSVDLSAQLIANLIRTHASGRAHMIGHSPGAQISVFVSGFEIFAQPSGSWLIPCAAWAVFRVENCIPDP
jgi:pimeloyl-ACP methyl ester carboxylesterase